MLTVYFLYRGAYPAALQDLQGKFSGACGAIESSLLSVTFEPVVFEPPRTTERSPPAMLKEPPLTLASTPLAVLNKPPMTLASRPLAVLPSPR